MHFSDEDIEGEDTEDQDMGCLEKRKMYLRGLRDLVPQLKHPDFPYESLSSGHFSLLAPKEKANQMPFCLKSLNRWQNLQWSGLRNP